MIRQKRPDLPGLGPGEWLWEPSLFRILGGQFRSQDHAAGASVPSPLVMPRAAAASIIAAALLLMTAGDASAGTPRSQAGQALRVGRRSMSTPQIVMGVRTVRTRVSLPHAPQR